MSTTLSPPPLSPEPPTPRHGQPRRGYPLLAWAVIVAAVVASVVYQRYRMQETEVRERTEFVQLNLQGRYLVGMLSLPGSPRAAAYEQARELNRGPYEQRFCYVILAGELSGPGEALNQLRKTTDLFREHPPTPEEEQLARTLRRLYGDYENDQWAAPSLSASERAELRGKLGWFGDLALAPAAGPDAGARAAVLQAARRTAGVLVGMFVLALGSVAVGLLLLVALVVLLAVGKLRFRLETGSPAGGIYAETFAVWMVLFMALNLLVSVLAPRLPLGNSRLLLVGLGSLLSLSALGWPVLRGVPWAEVRRDVGLWRRASPPAEFLWGVGCYLATLPLAFAGLIVTAVLMALRRRYFGDDDPFGPTSDPSHPIVEVLVRAGWWGRVQILLLASAVAPVVEETMFRGVLYRHLREFGATTGRAVSVLGSALLVSFVFAVIHPQGYLAVPMLMALALGFTLVRELRGSLVPAMVAHGLNNGLVTLLVLGMMS